MCSSDLIGGRDGQVEPMIDHGEMDGSETLEAALCGHTVRLCCDRMHGSDKNYRRPERYLHLCDTRFGGCQPIQLDYSRVDDFAAPRDPPYKIYRLKSSSLTRFPRFESTYCASTVIVWPCWSEAPYETVSNSRSITVCRRRAPIFSVLSFT